MGEAELIKLLAGSGVGGVLAAGMFWAYRKDSARWAESESARANALKELVEENTRAIAELTTHLRTVCPMCRVHEERPRTRERVG